VFRQSHSNGFTPDLPHDPALHHLGGDEPDRPPRVALRRRAADQRDDRCLIDAVELPLAAGPRFVGKRGPETVGIVSISNAFRLAVVPAHCFGSCEDGQSLVELLQRQDTSPRPRRKLLPLQAFQLAAIRSRQFQSRRTCRLRLHSNA
jgi:hypothetical protein